MKRLLILRHAKSSWADQSLDDRLRPLNERGRRDAPRAGRWLRERRVMPDLIIASDAVRARTTAEAVAEAAACRSAIAIEPSLYHAAPHDVIDVLRELPDQAHTVLVVGHNPGLEDLIQQLTGESHRMPTAALVDLELPIERWRDLDESVAAGIVESWQPRDEH